MVGPVPILVPALVAVAVIVLVALVEGLVVPLLLPLDAVRRQGERGWGLLAGPVVVEVVRSHVVVPPVHLLVERDVYVHVAGVLGGLHVEGLGHRLGGALNSNSMFSLSQPPMFSQMLAEMLTL